MGPRNAHEGERFSSSHNSVPLFIVTMITVMKCLSVLKPLSIALSIQLQKLDSDIRLTPKLVL